MVDFRGIVDRAANSVEQQERVIITREARDLLIERGEAHEEDVERALRGLPPDHLERAAADQFREALTGPGGYRRAGTIDVNAVEEGMRRKCHFVPWC